MQAIGRTTYGDGRCLEARDLPLPTPGDGEVRLRVHGSSVNKGDRLMLAGVPYLMRLAIGLGRPKQFGMGQDVAGVIDAVGPGVTDWSVGDAVFGEITFGSTWAEHALAPASSLAAAPTAVPLAEVGALPVAGLTALQAVDDHGGVQAGQRVVINGASGSVGSYVLGLCKHRGAHVTAVVRAHHADRARDLGADVVVDADAEDFTTTETPYDVCIDIAGSVTMARGLAAVRPGGTYVVIGGPTDDPWFGPVFRPLLWMLRGLFARQRVKVFVSKPSRQSLETLAGLVDERAITPLYDSACALSELPGAVVALDEGSRRGKVLVAVVSDHQTAPQPIS